MMRNPVFESSMKRRMRSFRSPLLITLYCAFLLAVSFMAIITLQNATISLNDLRSGLQTYIYLAIMQFMLIILVAPALTSGAISGERERQTLDLLLCTRVGAVRIVLGKLLSSVSFLALMIISSLPAMAITLFFGGISIWDMLLMELFLLITALACCSIGIFCSALFKRTVTATVVSYLAIFAIGVGTLIVPILFQSRQLSNVINMASSYSSSVGIIYSSGGGMQTLSSAVLELPKLIFVNPAAGLLSLLVQQTGMMQSTLGNLFGYRGAELLSVIEMVNSIAWINMVVLMVCSVLLTVVAALFVKPTGRRAKKRK